jgi:hypothetical protein
MPHERLALFEAYETTDVEEVYGYEPMLRVCWSVRGSV